MRLLSGALHAVGCLVVSQMSFPLLIASRVVHGYTIILFPLSVVWIGARDSVDQRATTLATRNACARPRANGRSNARSSPPPPPPARMTRRMRYT